MKRIISSLILVTVFAIAMGFLESAVVVYLREILYPEGFTFPLNAMPSDLALTEFLREAATLVMLVTVGLVAGKTFSQRFAWFIYAFAVWDIFYYVFLKLLIGWPDSIMTWDLLFLIPVVWTGPVVAPVMSSLTMILLALVILYYAGRGTITRLLSREWILLVAGAAVVFTAFIWDFTVYISQTSGIKEIFTDPRGQNALQVLTSYIPSKFNWRIFIPGEVILLTTIILYFLRSRKLSRQL